jgi:hypothetical protein
MHKYDVECECENCMWVRSVCDATDSWEYNGACPCQRCLDWASWNVPVQGCETAWESFTRRTRTIDRPNFRGLVVDGWWVDSYEAIDMNEPWPFPSWEEGGVIVNKAALYQLWLDGKVQ